MAATITAARFGPLPAAAMKIANLSNRKLLLGKCYPCHVPKATKVYVKMMDWDDWLKMYFSRYDTCYAYDPDKTTKTGDIVLIEQFPKRLTREITHKVLKIVYPMGDVTDPLTGKKVMGGEFREDQDKKDRLWGKNDNAFDYDSAPPRGWQEGNKDFSHKPAQRKFHEFNDRDTSHMDW